MRKEYYKLVRDRIPEIIHQDGLTCQTEIMTEAQFRLALRQKILEEAYEAMEAKNKKSMITELADLYEVLDTFMQNNGINAEMVQAEQEQRRLERGGFTQHIKLLWTE